MSGSKLTTVEFSVFQVKLDLKSAVELCNGGYDLHHHLLWSGPRQLKLQLLVWVRKIIFAAVCFTTRPTDGDTCSQHSYMRGCVIPGHDLDKILLSYACIKDENLILWFLTFDRDTWHQTENMNLWQKCILTAKIFWIWRMRIKWMVWREKIVFNEMSWKKLLMFQQRWV